MEKRQTIADAGRHDICLNKIRPIIDSEQFQRLHGRRQLGLTYLVFPAAHHTRFEHSLGVYALTKERAQMWKQEGWMTEKEAITLTLYGLLHDIGHGPYSHATEGLCTTNHNMFGKKIIEELHREIETCGGNMPLMRELFNNKSPLKTAVSHRPFGTDKLDYTERDSRYTTNTVSFRMGDVLNHIYYLERQLILDARFIPEALQVQREYVDMHDRVYFRKTAVILQFFFRQIIWHALTRGNITPDHLLDLQDSELDSLLLNSQSGIVRKLFERLRKRQLPKTAIALRPEETKPLNRSPNKPRASFRVPLPILAAFKCCQDRTVASVHENTVARLANIPAEAILIVPMAEIERFVPDEIRMRNSTEIIHTLREHRPKHHEALRESSIAYGTVRVCTFEEYRKKLSAPSVAQPIFEYLMSIVPT